MELLGVWRGNYVTAKSANSFIDAENIIKDTYKLKSQLEEINPLVASIQRTGSELTVDALSIDGEGMDGNFEQTVQYILETKDSQIMLLDEIAQRAAAVYNEKQDELNRQAQHDDRIKHEQAQARSAG